jgi:hypothetical protein
MVFTKNLLLHQVAGVEVMTISPVLTSIGINFLQMIHIITKQQKRLSNQPTMACITRKPASYVAGSISYYYNGESFNK